MIVPTLTFAATAFPISYLGAEPVFVDVDESWNINPGLLEDAIRSTRKRGLKVGAVIPVDLYGTPANYSDIECVLSSENIPLIEDAAEGLGAETSGVMARRAGAFGRAGVVSFNGNKIITSSGGGILVSDDTELIEKSRFWSTQAREDVSWYEHREIGQNYRMSNLLAALGNSQMRRIDDEVSKRRRIREWYADRFRSIEGISVQGDPAWGLSNAWLTVVRFDPKTISASPGSIQDFLESHDVEARRIWKPLHKQPVFSSMHSYLTGEADTIFSEGLCLPSGSGLSEEQVDFVANLIITAIKK